MAFMIGREIDQLTADLVVELQLQDVSDYYEASKGKSREPTDEELAFCFQNQELKEVSQYLEDRRMAISFAAAVEADGQILAENQLEEDKSSSDRHLARQLQNNGKFMHHTSTERETDDLDEETLQKLQILYVSGLEGPCNIDTDSLEIAHDESSTWASRRPCLPRLQSRQCVACREEMRFVDVARAPCQHEYCRSCLEDLFKACIADESLFPPRCCKQPINMKVARIFLKSELIQAFEEKRDEYETPNRTYCYNAKCGSFIRTCFIEDGIATCPNCEYTTCINCKGRAHIGDCPNDIAMQRLLTTAQENGWQRCYSCWRVVELDHGCNHMTCPCGAQFCYNCGEAWKKCACEQWDEHRLLARAYQIINRDADHRPTAAHLLEDDENWDETQNAVDIHEAQLEDPQESESRPNVQVIVPAQSPNPRDILIARTIEELRNNHECEHERWRYVRGGHRCEECSHFLARYIFECQQCRLQACNRCRRNRI